ncbi:GroES-like protein [Alternaria alternata]|nr:GroES-like protein [Alternaria alternata]
MPKSVLRSKELPVSQRAAVSRIHNGHAKTSLEEVPVPQLRSGEILVKMTWLAICYNDIGLMRNYWPDTPFQTAAQGISGHEGVGKVVAIAEDVLQADLWRIGDRVGIKWLSSTCGECEFCINGHDEVHCVKPVFSG